MMLYEDHAHFVWLSVRALSKCVCAKSVLCFVRVAEHNSELQKEDSDKEIVVLKEESRRLREERIRLQTQVEEDKKTNAELQEQVLQLTKHVKVNHTCNSFFLSLVFFFLCFFPSLKTSTSGSLILVLPRHLQ